MSGMDGETGERSTGIYQRGRLVLFGKENHGSRVDGMVDNKDKNNQKKEHLNWVLLNTK